MLIIQGEAVQLAYYTERSSATCLLCREEQCNLLIIQRGAVQLAYYTGRSRTNCLLYREEQSKLLIVQEGAEQLAYYTGEAVQLAYYTGGAVQFVYYTGGYSNLLIVHGGSATCLLYRGSSATCLLYRGAVQLAYYTGRSRATCLFTFLHTDAMVVPRMVGIDLFEKTRLKVWVSTMSRIFCLFFRNPWGRHRLNEV